MPSTIQFANAAQLEAFLQFYQQYYAAAQTGATPVDIAVGLQFVETGGKIVAGQISNAQMQSLVKAGTVTLDTTAAQAFQQYLTAGGTTSNSLAATGAVANEIVANGAIATTSAGAKVVGLLSMNLPTVAAAIAPIAGVALGAGLYSLNPGLWEKISRALLPFCYDDTELMPVAADEAGNTYIPKEAVDALKNVLSNIEMTGVITETTGEIADIVAPITSPFPFNFYDSIRYLTGKDQFIGGYWINTIATSTPTKLVTMRYDGTSAVYTVFCSESAFTANVKRQRYVNNGNIWGDMIETTVDAESATINGKTFYFVERADNETLTQPLEINTNVNISSSYASNYSAYYAYLALFGSEVIAPEGTTKWTGVQYPSSVETMGIVTSIDGQDVKTAPYQPIAIPTGEPGVSLNAEQTASLTENKDKVAAVDPWITTKPGSTSYPSGVQESVSAPLDNPVPELNTELDPNADPSKSPPKDPTTDTTQTTPPINGGTSSNPQIPIIPVLPSSATGLLHVYNPTQAQLDAFGVWLWTTFSGDLIDTLSKLFNNPMDAVIGLHELYATPDVSGGATIRAGYLDSNVPSNLVGNRYTTINCGSIVVEEFYQNYLDYSPYTKCYIYLPFIGIVPVLADDIIGNAVNVTYHVDSYTGCCIAVVTVAREGYSSTVYQFEGNCAVEIPITSGYQSTLMGALIGIGATALTGNPHAGIAAANLGRASLGKSDVSHSGSFGSSYGAMGAKTPYIIVKRPTQKSVVNYNQEYGFPAHKRVTIGACSGYLRAREVHVISPTATDEEKARIEELLKSGVFVK